MVFNHARNLCVTPPATEPVSLAEIRRHCRVPDTFTDDDADLQVYVTTARTMLEEYCWSSFVTQTWDVWWSQFFDKMFIPHGPLVSVTSFQYAATEPPYTMTDIPAATYETSSENGIPFVRLKYLQTWPTGRGHYDDIKMRVSLGYGAASAVPAPIVHAIKLVAGDLYANREAGASTVTPHVQDRVFQLIAPYRLKVE